MANPFGGNLQTYTHGVIGAMAGTVLFPHNPVAQVACMTGAMVPDGSILLIYVREKGRGGEYNQSKLGRMDWMMVNASHSFVVWAFFSLLAFFAGWLAIPAIQAFFIGAVVFHVFVDTLTHNGKKSGMLDAEYLWPIGIPFSFSFAWEYRTGQDYLWPKPFEAVVIVVSLLATIVLHLVK